MGILIFADGTKTGCSKFLFIPELKTLYVLIPGITWVEAATLFSDPEKTRTIVFGDTTITGYSNLDYIMAEADGIKACLSTGS